MTQALPEQIPNCIFCQYEVRKDQFNYYEQAFYLIRNYIPKLEKKQK